MKKCPFCKADIEDNARFCLYCMKPLGEKNTAQPLPKKQQWWPFAAIGALVILVVLLLLLQPRDAHLPDEKPEAAAQTAGETTQDTQAAQDLPQDSILPDSQETEPKITDGTDPSQQNQKPEGEQPEAEDTKPAETKPTQPDNKEETLPPDTPPATQPETTAPEETTEAPTQVPTQPETPTQPEAPKSQAVYTYRVAQAGDEFNANYQNAGNDIVITGISQPAADGVYDIPAYIDGKKVIAIAENAFNGSNAKVVYVPATVKNIWNYAFYGCGLTDIYFRGSAIYVESKAFSGALTIHCASTCNDRNFRYFKNTAPNYGATWAEWNG